MLVSSSRSVRSRVARIVGGTFAITAAGLGLTALGARLGYWNWPPEPSSAFGVACGFALAALVAFEMLILPRKWLRGYRLFRTKHWMTLHIVVGLVGLPLVLVHAGFGFGGPLPATTLVLFLLVTLSGIWGLILQQWLPQKMLREIPHETIASQMEQTAQSLVLEAKKLVDRLVNPPLSERIEPGDGRGSRATMPRTLRAPPLTGPAAAMLLEFHERRLSPYLLVGENSGSTLASRSEATRHFDRLRSSTPDEAEEIVDALEALTDTRRQWDSQRRMNHWLHNWLLVHLPLSVAMTVLMLIHAVRALKYW